MSCESVFVSSVSAVFRTSLQTVVDYVRDKYNVELSVQELADVLQLPPAQRGGAFITPRMPGPSPSSSPSQRSAAPSPQSDAPARSRAPAKRKTAETHTAQCTHVYTKGVKQGARCTTMIAEDQSFCSSHRPATRSAQPAKTAVPPPTVFSFDAATVPEAVFVSLEDRPGLFLHPRHRFLAKGEADNWVVVGVLDEAGEVRSLTDRERETAAVLRYTVSDSEAAPPAKKTPVKKPIRKTPPKKMPAPQPEVQPEPEPEVQPEPEPEVKKLALRKPVLKKPDPEDDDLSISEQPQKEVAASSTSKPKLPTLGSKKITGIDKLKAMTYTAPKPEAAPAPAPATTTSKLSLRRK